MQSVLKKKNGFAYIFDLSKEKNPRDIVNGLNNVSLSVEMIEIVNSFPTLDPRLYLFFFFFLSYSNVEQAVPLLSKTNLASSRFDFIDR